MTIASWYDMFLTGIFREHGMAKRVIEVKTRYDNHSRISKTKSSKPKTQKIPEQTKRTDPKTRATKKPQPITKKVESPKTIQPTTETKQSTIEAEQHETEQPTIETEQKIEQNTQVIEQPQEPSQTTQVIQKPVDPIQETAQAPVEAPKQDPVDLPATGENILNVKVKKGFFRRLPNIEVLLLYNGRCIDRQFTDKDGIALFGGLLQENYSIEASYNGVQKVKDMNIRKKMTKEKIRF